MSYTTYTTDAIVCGTYDRNTADRTYRLLTRELGMVWADARSVRLEKSKQRFGLCDFSYVRVSLVRGKSGWKIGSVTSLGNYYQAATTQAARGSIVRICRVLRRYLQGEEAQPVLFDFVSESLETLTNLVPDRAFAEQIIVVRVLAELGYVPKPDVPEALRTQAPAQLLAAPNEQTAAVLGQLLTQAEATSHL